MAGLLDDPNRMQSLYAGLLPLGMSLLAAGQQQQNPGARMQALMQGAGGFASAQQGYARNQMLNAQTKMQLAKAQREEDQRKAWQAAFSDPSLLGSDGGAGSLLDPSQPQSPIRRAGMTPPGSGTLDFSPESAGDSPNIIPAGMTRPGPTNAAAALGRPVNPLAPNPIASIPPALRQAIMMDPEKGPAFLTSLLAKQTTPIYDKQGQQIGTYGADGKPQYLPDSVLERMGYAKPTDLQRNAAAAGLKEGTPEYAKFITDAVNKPLASVVNPPQESAESKKVGDFFGDTYTDLQKADLAAPSKIGRLNRLDALLSKTYTGTGGGTVQEINKAMKAAGDAMGLDTSNLTDKVGSGEAAASLANQMALELRNPSGGAGMPGALSNSDRDFLSSMTPGIGTTPEGRKQIIETSRRLVQRDRDVAKIARDYRKKNGHVDEGLYEELSKYADANPLFKDMKPIGPAPGGGGANVDALLQKYAP